ncbi:uncharacterized protein [Clytia hemisphaerica]|uniref:Uncharacterized protein n=1 Tax=Clytia hemisphaerica TaxID=252671 RepID=A0A7M5WUT5_9CNID
MGSSNIVTFTLLRYGILTSLVIAGALITMSVSRQDWMREELKMKMHHLGPLFDMASNITGKIASVTKNQDLFSILPEDSTIDVMAHFGLRKTCLTLTASGMSNPVQLVVPEMTWCVKNDIFGEPWDYGVTVKPFVEVLQMLEDEASALKTAYICMALALLFVVIGLIFVVLKAFKYPTKFLFGSLICCIIACVFIISALGVVHNKFEFKSSYNQVKRFLKYRQSSGGPNIMGGFNGGDMGGMGGIDGGNSRRRRDDGSPGYSGHYTTDSTMGRSGGVSPRGMINMALINQIMGNYQQVTAIGIPAVMEMAINSELKESIGSPLIYAGLACGTILLVALLSCVEYMLIRRSSEGEDDVKYQNVALT